MSKALTVLAECVDVRTRKRFKAGEVFDPAPTVVQAKRLVAAGCLSEAAVDAAMKADSEVEQAELLKKKQAEAKASEAVKAARAELEKLTNPQLHELATAEGIAVESDDNKGSLVEKIIAGRAAKG